MQRVGGVQSGIVQRLIEASNRATVHVLVFPVPAMCSDNAALIAIAVGVGAGSAQGFTPVGGKSLDMLRVKAVAEGMGDDIVGHHPPVPGLGKTE